MAVRFKKGFDGALEHARAALELADDLDDDALRVDALAMLTFFGCAVGDPDAPAHAARAHELATAAGDVELLREATDALANVLDVCRDLDAARALLERAYHEWHERDELWAAGALSDLSWVELWGGRWQAAADYAARALDISVQYGLDVPWNHLADRGDRGPSRPARGRSRALGAGAAARRGADRASHACASRDARLCRAPERRPAHGRDVVRRGRGGRPRGSGGARRASVGGLPTTPRRCSSSVGWTTRCESSTAWEADARRLGRDWVLAHVTRCRGLVAAARGDVSEAASLLENAVTQHETVGDAFGRARALLALGVVRRRERQKRAARDAIGAALGEFERLGAATWVEKARAELGRIGGRTRIEGLTPAERRVAALVAEGRTNREVAAALVLGRAHGGDAPDPRLRQARCALAGRARADISARRAKLRGTRDFKLSALAYGRACAELPRRDVPRTRRRR